jgi:acyl-CoA synthetase (AMP-forming)/AMP-acid ligase II
MTLVERSEALHERVRRFARGEPGDDFEQLGLEIARFQAEASASFRALCRSRGSALDGLSSVPGVPSDAFRLTRVAVHPAELDAARFATSGTTGSERGVHVFRTTETYEEIALIGGARALLGFRPGPRVVASLAPRPSTPPSSSLGFMLELFHRAWDGRSLRTATPGEQDLFVPHAPERWLVSERGIELAALEHACHVAVERREPLLVLATAFALVALLDALGERTLPGPAETAVMVTGGFKGRSREVERGVLRRDVARAFGVPESHVVAEYGMTELTSQLYEGTLPGAALSGEPDVLLEPPWLRVVPVDPETLEPVPPGELGIARIVDLGNVDSALVVQTEDLVRRRGDGIELLGRRPGASARGCSLALEALLR